MAASLGTTPKKASSNWSTPASTPRAGTYAGSSSSAAGTPAAASSARSSRRIDTWPATTFAQYRHTSSAPGKRPARPTIAMSPDPAVMPAPRR